MVDERQIAKVVGRTVSAWLPALTTAQSPRILRGAMLPIVRPKDFGKVPLIDR
jgi:hypothetical protein